MSNSTQGPKLPAGMAAQEAARRAAEAAQRAAEAARQAAARQAAAQAQAAAARAPQQSREGAQQRVAQLAERLLSGTAPVNLRGDANTVGVRHGGGLSPSALQALVHGNKLPTYDVNGANRYMSGFRYAEEGAGTSLVDSVVAMELNGGRVDYGRDNALNCTQASVVAQDYFHGQQPPVETELVVAEGHSVLRMPDGRYYDASRAITGQDPFLSPEEAAPFQGVDGVTVAEREELAASAREAMDALPPGASAEERRRAGTAAARRESATLGSDGQAGEVSANQLANGIGIPDFIEDAVDDVVDGVTDLATNGVDVVVEGSNYVIDEAGQLVSGVAEFVTDAGTFVADAAAGTIDFVGDAATASWDAVSNAVQIAAEQGLELSGELAARARQLARDTLLGPLDIGGNTASLGVGDSYTFAIGGEVSAGASVEAAGEIQIERTQENGQDTYTVSASLEVDIGLTIPGATVTVGAGGKVEYKFDNPQDAARAAEIIAMAAAAKAMEATPGFKPLSNVMMPSQEDMDFLNGNLSAVEISGDVAIGVEAELGLGGSLGASGEAGAGATLRVEFQDGQPAFIEIKAKAKVEASGSLTLPLVGDVGGDGLTATGGEVEGSAEVEVTRRYPVKPGTTLGDLLSDPGGSIDRSQEEVSSKLTLELSGNAGGGDRGVKVEIDLSAIPPDQLVVYLAEAARGNPGPLLQAVQGQPRTDEYYTDRGIDETPELTIGGQGFKLKVQSEVRDVEEKS